ncbi:unnamed protein product, partial [Prorocentrum cordatum]
DHGIDFLKFGREQVWSNDGAFKTAEERFAGYMGLELMQIIFHFYPIVLHFDAPFINSAGQWAISRDKTNSARGDDATIEERAVSIETVGLLHGLGGGAWLKATAKENPISPSATCTTLHWGPRCDGMKRAYDRGPKKLNAKVQMSARTGLKDTTIFPVDTPTDILEKLVSLGNSMNTKVLATTFIEVMESTDKVEALWKKQKIDYGWSHGSIGQGAMEASKKAFFQAAFDNQRWDSTPMYENCPSFYK